MDDALTAFTEGNSVVVAHHDSLTIERRFSRHSAEVSLLAVDTQSEIGAGRLVVSYDTDMTAIVWDLMTGDEVARFASYENLTCAAWMRNGNVAFGESYVIPLRVTETKKLLLTRARASQVIHRETSYYSSPRLRSTSRPEP